MIQVEITNEQIERVNNILSSIPGGAEKALYSAMSRALSTAQSRSAKKMAGVYAIAQKGIKAGSPMKIEKPKSEGDSIVGAIDFSGFKIPLYQFNVTPKNPNTGQQVKAAVMRDNSQTPFVHAFITEFRSGHVGVFERDTRTRLPVSEVMGVSVAQMAKNTEVEEEMSSAAQETLDKRIEHEITRILNGYGT